MVLNGFLGLNTKISPKTEWCIGVTQNGEKIYQTRVSLYPEMGSSSETVSHSINHGIQNIKEILNVECGMYKSSTNQFWKLPYFHTANQTALTWVDVTTRTQIGIRNKTDWTGHHLFVIMTYTKTTG